MGQRCEVCENFRPEGDLEPGRKLVEVAFGERNVVLCSGHAQIAENAEIASLDALRDFYRESHGNRSFVERRARGAATFSDERRQVGRRFRDANR
jgi:hypothetical protein